MQAGAADDLAVAIDAFEYVDAARLHVITSALGKRYRTLVQVKTLYVIYFCCVPSLRALNTTSTPRLFTRKILLQSCFLQMAMQC